MLTAFFTVTTLVVMPASSAPLMGPNCGDVERKRPLLSIATQLTAWALPRSMTRAMPPVPDEAHTGPRFVVEKGEAGRAAGGEGEARRGQPCQQVSHQIAVVHRPTCRPIETMASPPEAGSYRFGSGWSHSEGALAAVEFPWLERDRARGGARFGPQAPFHPQQLLVSATARPPHRAYFLCSDSDKSPQLSFRVTTGARVRQRPRSSCPRAWPRC